MNLLGMGGGKQGSLWGEGRREQLVGNHNGSKLNHSSKISDRLINQLSLLQYIDIKPIPCCEMKISKIKFFLLK